MSRKIYIPLLALLFILTVGGIILYINYRIPKVYYVDIRKVYNEFELKKELERKLEGFTNTSSNYLDSLEMMAGVVDKNSESYMQLASLYTTKNEEFTTQEQQLTAQYDEQIWAQLNKYMQEYGKEYKCDFLLGGNGSGNVMYADDAKDITDKMILYVNKKYNGE